MENPESLGTSPRESGRRGVAIVGTLYCNTATLVISLRSRTRSLIIVMATYLMIVCENTDQKVMGCRM